MTIKDDIIGYVRILLDGSNIQISDGRLSFLVDEFMDEVLVYCNRDDFPDLLARITAKIIYAYLGQENKLNGGGTSAISSISEDGRSVNFDMGSISIDSKNQIYADTLLNRFRKLYKISEVNNGN